MIGNGKYYREFVSLPEVKRTIEEERNIIKGASKQKDILGIIKTIGDSWLKAYNLYGKDYPICKILEDIYQDSRLKAKQLGVNISKYPKTLEELTK